MTTAAHVEARVHDHTVGWYVHHHGAGHLTRFRAIRPHLAATVTVFSSLPRPAWLEPESEWIVLDRDDTFEPDADGDDVDPTHRSPSAHGMLHWAPLGHRGHAARLAEIATRIAQRGFSAFVVDVSVEVALLARTLGVRTVVVTQPGDRSDLPHQLAYQSAERILAPWPDSIPLTPSLTDVAGKVCRVGGISRFAGRSRVAAPHPGRVLVIGSAAQDVRQSPAWVRIGPPWIDDPWDELCRAEVVVMAAGQNAVADVAAAGARAIVAPESRPFDEQIATADLLAQLGLARVAPIVGEPDWPSLVAEASSSSPDWRAWQVDGAAQRAAEVIAEVARERISEVGG